jgi:hypothetical protein
MHALDAKAPQQGKMVGLPGAPFARDKIEDMHRTRDLSLEALMAAPVGVRRLGVV